MPFTKNCKANNVLPHPALPQISVGLPAGMPPLVTSSSPAMPVGVLGNNGVVIFLPY
jgi:hypothetical protein